MPSFTIRKSYRGGGHALLADPRAVVRFSYAEFKAKYGETVFGSAQPKRALEAVADEMYARGYEVKAGVQEPDVSP